MAMGRSRVVLWAAVAGGVVLLVVAIGATAAIWHETAKVPPRPAAVARAEVAPEIAAPRAPEQIRLDPPAGTKRIGRWHVSRTADPIYDEIVTCALPNTLEPGPYTNDEDEGGWVLVFRQSGSEPVEVFIKNRFDNGLNDKYPLKYRFDDAPPVSTTWSSGSAGSNFCHEPQSFLQQARSSTSLVIRAHSGDYAIDLEYDLTDVQQLLTSDAR